MTPLSPFWKSAMQRRSAFPHSRQLRFEPLEDRRMLSVSLQLNGPQTITPGSTQNVTGFFIADDSNDQSEMQIVVNPTNPLNVVGFSHRIGDGISSFGISMDVYRSTDGGATWFTTTRIDGVNDDGRGDDNLGTSTFRFDPAATFDANGRLYIAYGVRGGAGPPATPTSVVAAVSTDGGLNFTNFRVIDFANDRNGAGTTPPGVDKWYLASGLDPDSGNQAVYISYVNFGAEGIGMTVADDRIMVAGTRDGGANWTTPFSINDPSITGSNTGSSYASPVVGRNGELAISWHDSASDTIFLDRDIDGLWATAENFGADVTVRTGVTVDRSVNLPPAQPQRGVNAAPMLEVWRDLGRLYMPVVLQSTAGDLDIWVGESPDFGVTWDFRLIDASTGDEFNPWLQLDQTSGVPSVLYYTTDGDVATGNDDVRPRLATKFDPGTNIWTTAFLSNQTSNEAGGTTANDYLEYNGLAARDGTVHGLWASRHGAGTDLDAFTARAAFVSSTGDNRLYIGESGGADDYFEIRQVAGDYLEVFVDGVREFTGLSSTLDKIILNPGSGINTFNIGTLTGISSITINGTNNVDTYNFEALGSGTPLTMFLGAGADIVTLATSNSLGAPLINAPISIHGDGGDDTLNMGSGFADLVAANITFDGGETGGGANNKIVFHDTSPTYQVSYDIGSNFVIRDGLFAPMTVTYSNTQVINIQGGGGADIVNVRSSATATVQAFGYGGPDEFIIGDGVVGPQPARIYNGGGGLDTITFDDRSTIADSTWIIDPDSVSFYGGLFSVSTASFETVSCLAGSGNNTIQIEGEMLQNLIVDAGAGGDTLTLTNFTNWYDEDPTVVAYDATFDLGPGLNFLTVDESEGFLPRFTIRPTEFRVSRFLGVDGSEFTYANVTGGLTVQATDDVNVVDVFGTSPILPGFQHTMLLAGGADKITIYPRDAAGNSTLAGVLGIAGGLGIDELEIDDSASLTGAIWTINNPFGPSTQNVNIGGGAGLGAASDLESLVLLGSQADDTFKIESHRKAGELLIYANVGNDVLNITPTGGDVEAGINLQAFMYYDGGVGADHFLLSNVNNPNPWTYTRSAHTTNAGTLQMTRHGEPFYSKAFTQVDVEYLDMTAGNADDSFFIFNPPPNTFNTFRGGGGDDLYTLGGNGFQTVGIVSNVAVVNDNDGGIDSVVIDDTASTTGKRVHIDQYFVGGAAGDTLFGPGGYLYHVNIAGTITVRLGSGADQIFQATTFREGVMEQFVLEGNNPTSSPGDSLRVTMSTVTNPVFTPGGTGAGTYSFDDAPPIIYSGFETASAVFAGDFDGSGTVDEADYTIFQTNFGDDVPPGTMGDANDDGKVDTADYVVWRKNLGSVLGGPGAGSNIDASASPQNAPRPAHEVAMPVMAATTSTAAMPPHSTLREGPARISAVGRTQLLPATLSEYAAGLAGDTSAKYSLPSFHNRAYDLAHEQLCLVLLRDRNRPDGLDRERTDSDDERSHVRGADEAIRQLTDGFRPMRDIGAAKSI